MAENEQAVSNRSLVFVLAFLILAIIGLLATILFLHFNPINNSLVARCSSVISEVDYGKGGSDYATRLANEILDRFSADDSDYSVSCAMEDFENAMVGKDEDTRLYLATEYVYFLVEDDNAEMALEYFQEQEWGDISDIWTKIAYYETLQYLLEANGLDEEAIKYNDIISSLYDEAGDEPIDMTEEI